MNNAIPDLSTVVRLPPAMVATGLDTGRSPPEAVEAGLEYFLEIHICREVIEGWLASIKKNLA